MSFTLPLYATREEVKSALDSHETARNNQQIDRALNSASRAIEELTHRKFYPAIGVRKFDYPRKGSKSYRLWLGSNELVSVSSLVSGGVTIAGTDYYLRRGDDVDAAPYSYIEINLATSSMFSASQSWQRQTVVTGTFGYGVDTSTAGALGVAISSTSATSAVVTDSSRVGVGDLILVDTEYLLITDKAMLTTSQVCSVMTAAQSNVTITGVSAGTVFVGETILIDSERMLVVDVSGTTVTVKRAWDGSTLAAHNVSTTIYAPRTLTVVRGVQGSIAATHLISAAVNRHEVPGPVRDLAIAEAMNRLLQEGSGYARTVGSGDSERPASGGALTALRGDVVTSYGRQARMGP